MININFIKKSFKPKLSKKQKQKIKEDKKYSDIPKHLNTLNENTSCPMPHLYIDSAGNIRSDDENIKYIYDKSYGIPIPITQNQFIDIYNRSSNLRINLQREYGPFDNILLDSSKPLYKREQEPQITLEIENIKPFD